MIYKHEYVGVNNGDWGGVPKPEHALKEALDAFLSEVGYLRSEYMTILLCPVPLDTCKHRDICLHMSVAISYDPNQVGT